MEFIDDVSLWYQLEQRRQALCCLCVTWDKYTIQLLDAGNIVVQPWGLSDDEFLAASLQQVTAHIFDEDDISVEDVARLMCGDGNSNDSEVDDVDGFDGVNPDEIDGGLVETLNALDRVNAFRLDTLEFYD